MWTTYSPWSVIRAVYHDKNRSINSQYWRRFWFLGGLSLQLNHLIASRMANYDWPFGTLPFGLFWSNLDTRDLETYARTYSGQKSSTTVLTLSQTIKVHLLLMYCIKNQSIGVS